MTIESSPLGRVVVAPDVPEGFAVFWTTRDFPGKLTNDIAGTITDFIRDRFAIDASLTTCTQIHGAMATRAKRESQWRECDSCDALWSDERGSALGIKVADCLPITMIDPTSAAIANIHSGWRGALQGITAKSIDTIEKDTAFRADRAQAWLGPSIRVCCFEVGEEVAVEFDAKYVDRQRGPKPHVDLIAMTADILADRGFARDAIHDSALCTRCDGSIFHSYRRDAGKGGRNLAIAAM